MFNLLRINQNIIKPLIGGRHLTNSLSYTAHNEPILDYKSGSTERIKLNEKLMEYLSLNFTDKTQPLFDIPIVIGDKEIRNGAVKYQVAPHDHKLKLARFYHADKELVNEAIESNLAARAEWENQTFDYRAQVLLKAADTLANEKRMDIMAATMLGQGKTVFQAEIDCTCELVDFLRFNVQFLSDMLKYKPLDDGEHTKNNMILRGLEGFVAAIAPFNFTAIGGNLATAPALMGNSVLWKPSDTSVLSAYIIYKTLRESGLPAGVINFLPADGPVFGNTIVNSPHLAAVNFTGSVPTFKWLWKNVAQNLDIYRTFPRLSGECGGKNFHLIHKSADIKGASYATVRGAFEFSGQKCSATSRLYCPESKWPEMKEHLISMMSELIVDSPLRSDAFTSAVIDEISFDKISQYIEYGKKSPNMELLSGGYCNKEKGYFVQPTLFVTSDPKEKLMREEIFGPVLTAYVYKDSEYDQVMHLIDTTTPFALTGSIFCTDDRVLKKTMKFLKQTTGNLYINDKSTGAVVNQQPFGGARLSGTNDKPGGAYYLTKWTSPQSQKVFTGVHSSFKNNAML